MVTKDERLLPGNVLDALDRLFDCASTVVDVHALLVATRSALRETAWTPAIDPALRALGELLRSNAPPDWKRDQALTATNGLRLHIAQCLRADATENPKQRHVVNIAGVPHGGRSPT